jgi:AcrR family transcriptional regulator
MEGRKVTHRDDSPARPAGQLPRGFVPTNQREEILLAVAEVVSVLGYDAMTLEDVARHAGVEPDVVHGFYTDKEDAFLSAYGAAVWQGLEHLLEAIAGPEGFSDRIWAAWKAFIEFIVAEPAFASMCIVDVLAAGAPGIERRNMTLRGMAALVEQIADESLPADRPRPPELYLQIVLGGFTEIFREYLAGGRIAELPNVLPSLHYTLVVPFIGHQEALEEYERREREAR